MSKDQRAALLIRIERITGAPMLILAIIFLILLMLPEIWPVSQGTRAMMDALGWLIWGVFAFELAVKTYLASDRRRYLVTHWMDVLTVAVPFLRPLRLLRVAIIMVRLWHECRTLVRRRTFSVIGITSLLTGLLSALIVFLVERGSDGPIDSLPDALWWSVTTITTVGYGDTYPVTSAGRGVAVFLMLAGISLFGLLTARIAAFFVDDGEHAAETLKLDAILARLEAIEQQNHELRRHLEEPSQQKSAR